MEVGKKKSASTSKATVVNPQDGEVETLLKRSSTQEPVATLQDEGIEPLSEDKGTKKSLSRKKKEEKFWSQCVRTPCNLLACSKANPRPAVGNTPRSARKFLSGRRANEPFPWGLGEKDKGQPCDHPHWQTR